MTSINHGIISLIILEEEKKKNLEKAGEGVGIQLEIPVYEDEFMFDEEVEEEPSRGVVVIDL